MKIKFWGTRGSIPCPGQQTVRYGGNTTCLELRFGTNDRMVIIDAGTGIRSLGNHLLRHDIARGVRRLDIYLSHTHWDHILGFPFFAPMYVHGMTIRIHGPARREPDSLKEVLQGQFAYRYFPLRIEELASDIQFIELQEGIFDLGDDILLTTKYLNHPVCCMGYRFENGGRALATVFDMESFRSPFPNHETGGIGHDSVARGTVDDSVWRDRLVEQFYAGADLAICDAQYTADEYRAVKSGRGHSAMEEVVAACRRNDVKRLALTHHDPDRTDEQIDALAATICEKTATGDMQVFFAREGLEVNL